jgi:hypothetical protein
MAPASVDVGEDVILAEFVLPETELVVPWELLVGVVCWAPLGEVADGCAVGNTLAETEVSFGIEEQSRNR